MLISTIFTFVSCTRVKNKDLKVNILALTESESVYFIQKADTIENKCYIVTFNYKWGSTGGYGYYDQQKKRDFQVSVIQ